MTKLTKYDVALIGVRLLAIYVTLQVIGSIPTWLWTLSTMFSQSSSANLSSNVSSPFFLQLFVICLPLLTLSIPIIMWFLAGPIAMFITKSTPVISNEDTAVINIKDVQTMLFCTVGVFVFITTAPTCVALIYDFLHAYFMKATSLFASKWTSIPRLIELSLKMILSLFLIFSAQGLSNVVYKLRYMGVRK